MTAEEVVVRQACKGDPDAFAALVTPYLPKAHRVAYLITHDRQSAADAVQEALVRAYRSLANVRPCSQFYPWFTRIVVNEAVKQTRRRTKFYQPLVHQVRNFLGESMTGTPESAAEAREEHEYVWSAIERLSPAHRVVIVLRYYEELTEAEMANILDVPPGTVKSRLYHARKALEQMLQEPSPSTTIQQCLTRR